MAGATTPATTALARAGVDHRVHEYHAGSGEEGYGRRAAQALGVPEPRVFKTLMAQVDGRAVVAIVPVAGELDLKALAVAVGGKRAQMMAPADAQRRTGYVLGGISPFGQKQRSTTVLDESALAWPTVFVSAGRRGLELEVAPGVLGDVLQAVTAAISRTR
jgi:Cys-tRNA(Pro)/Cys-tRNA(Cys) deacylase